MKLLIAESKGFCPQALLRLQEHLTVESADLDRRGLLAAVEHVDALWVRLRNQVDAEVMDAAPRLCTIVTNTTGLNHIDLAEAERRGIRVLSLRGEVDFLKEVRATAELTLGLILALVRQLPAACEHARAGGWQRDLFKGHELYGKTAGIIGYGRLGRIVGRYLKALDMEVLATDPHVNAEDAADGARLVAQEELLGRADIVTLHVNLCEETRGFFGRRQFEQMKPGAWFVNTARGELLDEPALLAALAPGRLAGAALDVVSNERAEGMADHPLVRYAQTHDNLVLTPHIGGCTVESGHKTELFLARKLLSSMSDGA